MIATKQGELQLYSIQEVEITVKNLDFDLKLVKLVLEDKQEVKFEEVFVKGSKKPDPKPEPEPTPPVDDNKKNSHVI
jgi:hypothetical protein